MNARAKEINDQRATTEVDTNKAIDQLHQALEQRRVELIDKLQATTQEKLKSLAAQRDQIEITEAKLTSCLEYAEGGLETGTEGEVLAMKAPVLQRIEQITAEFDPATMQPEIEADIFLLTDEREKTNKACREFAEIAIDPVSAENSYVRGDGFKGGQVGKQAAVVVQAMNIVKKKCRQSINVAAKLVHCKSKATTECKVERLDQGQHRVTYQPASRGKSELHITLNGRHIRDSPFPIAVTPSLESLQKPVRVIKGLNKPFGTTVNSKGQIIVAEAGANCVSILTAEGEKVHSIGAGRSRTGTEMSNWGCC